MIFCVFFVGLSFTALTPVEYLSNPDTYLYLVRNMILFAGVEHYLPGVFLITLILARSMVALDAPS